MCENTTIDIERQMAELDVNASSKAIAIQNAYEKYKRYYNFFINTDYLTTRMKSFNSVGVKSGRPLMQAKLSGAFWYNVDLYAMESVTKEDLTSLLEIIEVMENDPILLLHIQMVMS